MSRARVLADRANQNTLAVDTTNSEVGIATSVPNSTLDVLGEVRVGSAIQAGVAGVVTATSFSGSGANLTGLATTETVRTDTITVAGVSTFTGVANFSAAVNADATTDSTSVSTGALIVDGGLGVAKNVYIGAGLSVAGTLTYEDVTNVDSVGLITAKSGVNVSGGQLAVGVAYSVGAAGVATAAGFVGGTISGTTGTFSGAVSGSTGTFTGDVDIADKIVHTGDTNTAIRFPAADTVTVETGGSERVRVASNGRVGVGTASPRAFLDLYGAAENATLLLESNDANANLCLMDDSGSVRFLNYGGELALRTGGTGAFTGDNERVRITSAGRLGIGITNPSSMFEVAGATPQIRSTDTDAANDYSVFQNSSGNSVYNAVDNNSAGGHIFQANASEKARIDSSGRLLIGHTATAGKDSLLQVISNSGDLLDLSRYVANEYGPNLHFVKSRNDTSGSHTIVQANDNLGIINFRGSDGDSFDTAAEITAKVDGTPGAGDMPGRLIFSTTADGANSATARMTMSASGQLRMGSDNTSDRTSHTVQCSASGNAKVLSLNNATNTGGSDIDLGFYARNSNNATVEFGRISVDATTTTANSSQAGYMAFFVNDSASMSEKLRITSVGNIEVNGGKVHIKEGTSGNGGVPSLEFDNTDTSVSTGDLIGSIAFSQQTSSHAGTSSRIYSAAEDNTGGAGIVFQTGDNGSISAALTLDKSQNATFGGSVADSKGDVRRIIYQNKTSGYTLVAADAGKAIHISTGGVTINNSLFSAGDAVTIINNSGSSQTITQGSGVTLYNTGDDGSTGNKTLAARGMCTVWFSSASVGYISGNFE